MRNFLFLSFSLLLCKISFAQLTYSEQKDTATAVPKKILIIPYEPKMHLSDADNIIAEYSEKNPQQVRMLFRTGVTNQLQATLVKVYPTHSMLANLSPEGIRALDDVYRYVDYSYDTVYSTLQKVNGNKEKREKALRQEDKDDIRYMNVKLVSKELIPELCDKFDVNLIIFLSQIEIKTKYADCLDASLNAYTRVIKVHYSVYDNGGKQVYGGIAKASLPTSSNEINEIAAEAFPEIANQIKEILSDNKMYATK